MRTCSGRSWRDARPTRREHQGFVEIGLRRARAKSATPQTNPHVTRSAPSVPRPSLMIEAKKGMRRLRGYRSLPILQAALRRHEQAVLAELDPTAKAA